MRPEEKAALEAQAERALRRGELSEAFKLFSQLMAAAPHDDGLKARVAQLKGSLQPAELLNPKSNFRADPAVPAATPEENAERHAVRGDYAGAIGIYQVLLGQRPDNLLVVERLAELHALKDAQAPRGGPAPPAPHDLLAELLDRVSTRRRR